MGTLTDRVRAGDLDAVRAALAAGESPDSLEPDTGLTALACAVDEARLDLVELLLDAGADVEGGRPIGHAARDRTAILARLLRAGADPNPRPGEDPPPLYAAVADVEAVALLLDHGADPNVATALGETPVSFCASWGLVDSLRRLLVAGADPNRPMPELDWPPLFFAAQEGDLPTIRVLIEHGADPLFVNDRGQTALAVALDHRRGEVAAALLPLGGWSESVDGVRGRLIVALPHVDVELQNVGSGVVEVTTDDPDALSWELVNDGAVVPPLYERMDVMSTPRMASLELGYVARWRASLAPKGRATLDLVTAAWEVPPGPAELRVRLAIHGRTLEMRASLP